MNREIRRGDIYYCDLGEINLVGSEMQGTRPVVIIQNNKGNENSTTTIVAPITSKGNKYLPTHINLVKDGYPYLYKGNKTILTEQLKVISKERLKTKLGHLNDLDLCKLNEGIKVSLAI